jgi:predicted dehydrogenase
MSTSSRPRIALLGVGYHGFHAVRPALLSLSKTYILCAVLEPHAENRARFLAAHPDIPAYTDAAKLYAEARPDLVYIATLPHLHAPLALEALVAGCHVVCEKPLAPTVAECEALVEAAKRADRVLVTMFENRYKSHHRRVREWIAEGRIGRVEAIHLQHFWPGPLYDPRRSDLLNATGSLDCGIHYLDLARFYVKGGNWDRIHAIGRWFDEPQLRLPPHIAIQATLKNGPLVTFEDSMSYRIAYGRRSGDRTPTGSLCVIGTEGIIERSPEGGVRLWDAQDREEFCPPDRSIHEQEIPWVLADLLVRLETGRSETGFLPEGVDGLIAQRIVVEANRQAVESRPALA